MTRTPKVTIVIPTRNRADTLRVTLRTCVMQDYEPLEILVSDNESEDATRDVIAAERDPRVRRVTPGRRVAMAQNWEHALGHVDTGYVLVVGDDDALLPNAVRDIAGILGETGCDGIGWREAKYYWPGCGGGLRENTLRMSVRTGWEVRDAAAALADVIAYRRVYTQLPSLYWGALSIDAIRRATPAGGAFFHSLNPDLYSAIATAMAMDRYVWSERPYRINGLSRHSTGVSFATVEKGASAPRTQFLSEGNLPFHASLELVPSSPLYVAEAYLQAREHVPGGERFAAPDFARILDEAMRVSAGDRRAAYDLVAGAIRTIAARHGLDGDAIVARHPFRDAVQEESELGLSLRQRTIKLDCRDFAVTDVHGAAVLCHTIARLFEGDYLSWRGIADRAWRAAKRGVLRRF